MIIEKKILDYLTETDLPLVGENVFMEVPVYPPEAYVVIEKTGGRGGSMEQAVFAVQSYSAKSLLDAATINHAVKEAMKGFRDATVNVFRCELNSDYNFTNTNTKEYRYQAVFNIYYQED
ncbi:MAG: hypothetical protein IKF42_04225 [Mogibacterium sp.]|nr:hypothetical protein [Mogibacterium sp.]